METRQKNIELVLKLYDAFAKKEIDKILEMLCDDVEWGEPENPYNPAAGTRKGHACFMKCLAIPTGKTYESDFVIFF